MSEPEPIEELIGRSLRTFVTDLLDRRTPVRWIAGKLVSAMIPWIKRRWVAIAADPDEDSEELVDFVRSQMQSYLDRRAFDRRAQMGVVR